MWNRSSDLEIRSKLGYSQRALDRTLELPGASG
jgi:hypothetical protein